jgi:hypothetical protein
MHFETCCHEEHVKAHGWHFWQLTAGSILLTGQRWLAPSSHTLPTASVTLLWTVPVPCNSQKSEGGMGISHRGSPILGDGSPCQPFGSFGRRIIHETEIEVHNREYLSLSFCAIRYPNFKRKSVLVIFSMWNWTLPADVTFALSTCLRISHHLPRKNCDCWGAAASWSWRGASILTDPPSPLTPMDTLDAPRRAENTHCGYCGWLRLAAATLFWLDSDSLNFTDGCFSVQQVLSLFPSHGCDYVSSISHPNGYIFACKG